MPPIEKLRDLEGAYRGRRGFILATGPSLAYKNLSFLGNEVTIALNLAPLMCDQWGFTPTFHMAGDRYIYPTFAPIFEQLVTGTPTTKIVVAAACESFPAHLADARTYFAPQMLPQDVVKFATNPIDEGFWRGRTVAYFAMQFAYFLGLDEVYVLGMDMTADHQWGSDAHCYELRRHPRFAEFEFPQTATDYVQRGWPGHPELREGIKAFLIEARRTFEAAGRRLVNDTRSAMDVLDQEDIVRRFSDSPHVVAVVRADGKTPPFLHVLDTLRHCHAIDEVCLDAGSAEIPDADVYVQARPQWPFPRPRAIDDALFARMQCPPRAPTGIAIEALTVATATLVVVRRAKTYGRDGRDGLDGLDGQERLDTREVAH